MTQVPLDHAEARGREVLSSATSDVRLATIDREPLTIVPGNVPIAVSAPIAGIVSIPGDDAEALAAAHVFADAVGAGRTGSSAPSAARLWADVERFSWSGLGSITVPGRSGGAAVSMQTLVAVVAVVCQAAPEIGPILQSQFLLLDRLRDVANEDQRQFLYAEVLAGRRLGYAVRESQPRGLFRARARLVKHDGGFRLRGRAFYSTGALFAHWIPIEVSDAAGQTSLVFLRRGGPGVRVIDDWKSFGEANRCPGSVLVEDAEIGADLVAPVGSADPGSLGRRQVYADLVRAAVKLGSGRHQWQALLNDSALNAVWADRSAKGEDRSSPSRAPSISFGERLNSIERRLDEAAAACDRRAGDSGTGGATDQTSVASSLLDTVEQVLRDLQACRLAATLATPPDAQCDQAGPSRPAVERPNWWQKLWQTESGDASDWPPQHVWD